VRRVGVLLVFDGAAIGAVFPFLTVMLAARGFDPLAIGLVTALSSAAYTIALPVWGHVADVVLGRVSALRIAAAGAALAMLVFLAPLPLAGLAACILAFTIVEAPVGALADALAVNAVDDPARAYPRLRVLFSGAMAAATIVVGIAIDRAGYGAVPLGYALCAVGVVVAAGFVPDVERASLARDQAARGGSVRAAFTTQPRLLPLVLLAVGLSFFAVTTTVNFLSLRLAQLGATPGDIALASALASVAEIPTALLAGRIAARIGLRGLFAASALLQAVVLGSWILTDSVPFVVASRALTGVTFAGLFVAVVLTIQATLPERLQGTGQGLFQATAFGAAAIVANIVGGALFGSAGAGPLFALAAVLSVLAAAVSWIALPARTPLLADEIVPLPLVRE
jgi:PPP family 3-phenylpropionic acid transporter